MIVCLHSTWYKGLRLEMPDLFIHYAINIASYWSGNETNPSLVPWVGVRYSSTCTVICGCIAV